MMVKKPQDLKGVPFHRGGREETDILNQRMEHYCIFICPRYSSCECAKQRYKDTTKKSTFKFLENFVRQMVWAFCLSILSKRITVVDLPENAVFHIG